MTTEQKMIKKAQIDERIKVLEERGDKNIKAGGVLRKLRRQSKKYER